jgi:DNA-binding transcriptional LysR family regulator
MDIGGVQIGLLRCLVVLVEERSVTRSAKRLHLSQPATSHALTRLRTLFGDPLLVRVGNEMLPTSRAAKLHQELARIVDEVSRLALPEGTSDPASASGTRVIVAAEHIAHRLGPGIARVLQRDAPNLRLEIRRTGHDAVDRSIETGEVALHLGLIREPPPGVRYKFLYTERMACLLRSAHPRVGESLTLEQFLSLPHVRAQPAELSSASRFVDEAVGKLGRTVRVALIVPSHVTIGRIIAGSDMIAVLPEGIAADLAKRLPVRSVVPPMNMPGLRVSMYWHERNHRDPHQRWLRQAVASAAADDSG